MHKPSDLENETYKILLDFVIQRIPYSRQENQT